jgi:hypothetical protein
VIVPATGAEFGGAKAAGTCLSGPDFVP